MSNRSISTSPITRETAAQLLKLFQSLTEVEVIINGEPWAGGCTMFTFLNCSREEYARIKRAPSIRALSKSKTIASFGKPY